MTSLPSDILDRLNENKKLYERPGLGRYLQSVSSYIALHGFWVLLVVSLVSAVFFLRTDAHWWANDVLFGGLY